MTLNSEQHFDVAISGASFAGLALARGLVQALGSDVRLAIVDPIVGSPRRRGDNRAFAIWAGAKNALDGLGVWPAIVPFAQPMTSIEISDSSLSDGVRPALLTYDAKTADGAPVAYMVPAAVLQDVLYQSIARESSVTWIAAEACRVSHALHAVLTLDDERQVTAQLCVAADGRNSKLRDSAGIKTVGWDYAQTGIVVTIAFSDPHEGVAIQHFFPGGPFAILPLKDNRACITWSAERTEATRVMALDDDAFLAELDQRIGGRFGIIKLAGPRQSWPLDVKLPRELTAPRFALVGDAAHGVHPIAGQGVNLALRDAAALIEVLVDAARIGFDFGHGPALERYGRWRRFDATMSAGIFDGLNKVFSADSTVLRAGRGVGLGLLDRLPDVKRMLMSEAAGMTGELPKLMRGEAV